ncbi:hypothetical protein BH10PSE17_BH10PSE17_38650 [soil metagenome]
MTVDTTTMDPAEGARLRAEQRRKALRSGLVFGSIAIAFFIGIIVKIAFFGI